MSVTTETLRIVNEVVYKGKGEANKLKSDMQTTEKEVTKSKVSFDKLATAAGVVSAGFGVVAVAASKFYSTLKAGAEIQAAAFTFDNLTASIGSTSSAMLGDLQTATKGMISDLDLMNFASQTVAMGLGSTNEEVAALAELGSTLGAAFRGDAVAGMEEFNLLLANQSIPRLDSFGISAGRVRTRIAELQEQFPDMTREAAFTQAVLEEGQTTMAKLGDSSETAAASMGVLEANLKNAKDEALAATTEGFTPLIVALADLSTLANDFGVNVDWNEILGGIGFGPGRELTTILEEIYIAGVAIRDNPWWVWFNNGLSGVGDTIEDTRWQLARMENDLTTGPLYSTGAAIVEDFNDEAERLPPVAISYVNSMTRMGDAHDQLVPAANASTAAVKGFAEFSSTTFLDALAGVDVAAFDVEQALLQQAAAAGVDQQSLVLLAAATGDYTQIQIQAALEMAALTAYIDAQAAALAAGNITWREALANVQAFKAELDALPPTKTVQVVYEQVTTGNAPGQGPSITSATGNVFPHGGMSLVGEFGPEFVRLPAGAQVVSTNQTRNISNSTTINGTTRRGEQVLLQHLRRQSRPATILG